MSAAAGDSAPLETQPVPSYLSSTTNVCASCGQLLSERYCPRCGQRSRDLAQPLWPLLRELVMEAFELDSRLLRTLRGLLRPGFLTAEFCRGRRAAYTSPVRLYLVSSLVCFTLLALTGDAGETGAAPADPATARAQLVASLADPDTRRLLASLDAADRERFVQLQVRRGVTEAPQLVAGAGLERVDAVPGNLLQRIVPWVAWCCCRCTLWH